MRGRITPKGWVHPCRAIERKPESSGKTRFLSSDERERLLAACKASAWPRLYLLALLAVTTGARRSELQELRWADIDFEHASAHIGRSKNNDPKSLPLVPGVIAELRRFEAPAERLVTCGSACGVPRAGSRWDWRQRVQRDNAAQAAVRARLDEQAAELARPEAKLSDFYAHLPDHRYIHLPTRELWPASSVDGRVQPWPGWTERQAYKPEQAPRRNASGRADDVGAWVADDRQQPSGAGRRLGPARRRRGLQPVSRAECLQAVARICE